MSCLCLRQIVIEIAIGKEILSEPKQMKDWNLLHKIPIILNKYQISEIPRKLRKTNLINQNRYDKEILFDLTKNILSLPST